MNKLLIYLFASSLFFLVKAQETTFPQAWITGTWIGDGFGGVSEEVWSEPSADGTIMGMFRHHSKEGALNFYEFFVLDEAKAL